MLPPRPVRIRASGAFSTIELICALVLLAVLAALAIPKLTRAASYSPDDELRRNLAVLRMAIEMYYDQHGAYPGATAAGGAFGRAGSAAAFVNQLTRYTDAQGRVSDQPGGEFRYGPYLRNGIPPCTLVADPERYRAVILAASGEPANGRGAGAVGWLYDCQTGHISICADGIDARGVRYRDY